MTNVARWSSTYGRDGGGCFRGTTVRPMAKSRSLQSRVYCILPFTLVGLELCMYCSLLEISYSIGSPGSIVRQRRSRKKSPSLLQWSHENDTVSGLRTISDA